MIEVGLFDTLDLVQTVFCSPSYPPAVAARAIPLDPCIINYGNNQESRGITRAAMAV